MTNRTGVRHSAQWGGGGAMQSDKQKTAGKGKKVRGGFKTSEIGKMFECGGVMLP